jgi:hypothetical protein
MNDLNTYGCCNYPAEVFPRPVRRVIRLVILFNLTVLMVGAVLFSIYGGLKVVREVGDNPRAFQTRSSASPRHANPTKGQRP